jgi:predicted transcriptional regulator
MYGYIYITTNLINGMQYIGKRKGEFFPKYLGSGLRLKKAIRIHGRKNFSVEILSIEDNKESLDLAEIFTIAEFDAVNSSYFYNIASGGSGGLTYSDRSLHIIPHMQRANLKYKDLPNILKDHSQSEAAEMLGVDQSAIAQRIREHNIEIVHSDEYLVSLQRKRETSAKMAHHARRENSAKLWAEHDLQEMYKKYTQAEIAKIVGVSQVRVSQKLKELNISKK